MKIFIFHYTPNVILEVEGVRTQEGGVETLQQRQVRLGTCNLCSLTTHLPIIQVFQHCKAK